MDNYKKLAKELIEDHITDTLSYNKDETRRQVLLDMQENGNEDVFGNMSGSRTCNTYEAQQFIDKSGAMWDDEILDMFNDLGEDYFTQTLKRGAETLDVVILELLSSQVISELLESTE